jgi:hypothetical protein
LEADRGGSFIPTPSEARRPHFIRIVRREGSFSSLFSRLQVFVDA